ncbi:MAG: acetyl-CoA carboxylase biotin carboxyl carrier protein [Gemmatimonadaceae bacterium]|jgi:acetyl-CoA carboxylase biotin carboxyl carrier protein|nr:acetyl-CoA carboxylase biotin carboxyl carrier protein [Gemmatimonadaceae bacterium]
MIDLRYLKKVLEMLDESTVDSLEITNEKGMKLRVSKSPTARGTVAMAPMAQMAPMPTMAAAPSPAAAPTSAPSAPAAAPEAPKSTLIEVKSPMVGTYYAQPEPGAKPYASVGTRVSKGQVLCIIEAMKIMNEIECEVSGTITEVCVQDASSVEYGQVLFRVDPNG